VADSDSIAVI